MNQKYPYLLLKLFSCVFVVLAMQSCGPGKPGIWKNEKIKQSNRDNFHKLNTEVLNDLQTNRYKALQFLLSKPMLDDGEVIRTVENISHYMQQDSFRLLREYYIVSKPETRVTIGERELSINNFELNYQSLTDEMYVAFFVQPRPVNKRLISAIYNKYDYGWKLSSLEISQYTVAGKTAPELFTRATAEINKGYLIDAVNTMSLAEQCMQPTAEWQYVYEDQMSKLQGNLLTMANQKYKLPFDISQVATHPQIIRVFNQKTADGQFPMVYYLSKIKLKDTVALKKENQEIKKVIGALMPGIDKNKKYVLYAAFNEKPNAKTSVDHFDMTDKLQ